MADQQFTNPEEIWKEIPGYPGYEISDYGNVKSWKNPKKFLKPSLDKNGYHKITLFCKDHKPKRFFIHRLVLTAFVGLCPVGYEACHNDGKHGNNHLWNLRWDTPTNNQADRHEHGTANYAKGEECGKKAKLTEEDIHKIRLLSDFGIPRRDIAKEFNLSYTHTCAIIRGDFWKHLYNSPSL